MEGLKLALGTASAVAALWIPQAWASEQVGTLTQVFGEVRIFSHPSKARAEGPPPHALFEGMHYSVQDAKVGDRVEKGNIVRTATGGRAKVIFDNGDQFYVHSGTGYRISWDKDTADSASTVQLMHGRLRGVIEKGGPRSKFRVRTKSATMGVRGTDFFVAEDAAGGTEFTVLRGKIEVKPLALGVKAVQIVAGQTAEVVPAPQAEGSTVAPKVSVAPTTQQSLVAIQKSAQALAAEPAASAPEKIRNLEERAFQTTLGDIKKTDPKLYAQVQAQSPKSAAELNKKAVEILVPAAPKAPEKHKPGRTELEDLGGDVYDKYFKIGE